MVENLISMLIFVGPSGVGKSTLANEFLRTFPSKFSFSISHTTRSLRGNEVDGKHYYFITKEQMKEKIENNEMLEFDEVHSNFYGTSKSEIERITKNGQISIMDVSIKGAINLKKSDFKSFSIFLLPPSFEELERRLRGRRTESDEKINERLENAKKEIEFSEKNPQHFDQILVNDDLKISYKKLKEILLEKFGKQFNFFEKN
ncbi:guanylate kinase-related [Anaeramoeba ignava]|uniref:guanylate kinase n=1 Tax=Anaeramoeba ignava TaxID=1746090 RepID=A0A9Q0LR42_ANAIG|nr:guanylate kinase-related [Anaeramoeba ignava]